MLELTYIDHNIVLDLLGGDLGVSDLGDIGIAYSIENMREIRLSHDPDGCLQVLSDVEGTFILVEDGLVRIIEGRPVRDVYEIVCREDDSKGNTHVFDALIAVLNGGQDFEKALRTERDIAEMIAELMKGAFSKGQIEAAIEINLNNGMAGEILGLVENQQGISDRKKSLGIPSDAFHEIDLVNAIEIIWGYVGDAIVPGKDYSYGAVVNRDQFFGFSPAPHENVSTELPLFEKIIRCCGVFNAIGFLAEKKIRKVKGIPNAFRDTFHLATGSFCSRFMSRDVNLISRGRAIFSHLDHGCIVLNPDD